MRRAAAARAPRRRCRHEAAGSPCPRGRRRGGRRGEGCRRHQRGDEPRRGGAAAGRRCRRAPPRTLRSRPPGGRSPPARDAGRGRRRGGRRGSGSARWRAPASRQTITLVRSPSTWGRNAATTAHTAMPSAVCTSGSGTSPASAPRHRSPAPPERFRRRRRCPGAGGALAGYPSIVLSATTRREAGSGGAGALASVAVLQAHHVVDLRRGDLEEVGVLDRRRNDGGVPVGPGRSCPASCGAHAPRRRSSSRTRSSRPGRDEDRLVLLHVVLQAELMTLVDVDELAQVPIGDRPAELVSPGLVDAIRVAAWTPADPAGSATGSAGMPPSTPTWLLERGEQLVDPRRRRGLAVDAHQGLGPAHAHQRPRAVVEIELEAVVGAGAHHPLPASSRRRVLLHASCTTSCLRFS